MKNRAESILEISQDKETLFAMITHDLKNPITAGMVAIKLLEDKKLSPLNPYQKEIVTNIAGNYKYMKNLIENLLDRYRVINNQYKINKQPANFLELITSAVEEYRFLFEEKNQSIIFSSSVRNVFVNLDILEIKRVINNLITNASNYAPRNSEIKIFLYKDKKSVFCSIENEGCNFQSSRNIFDKFCTGGKNMETISLGLGLYISKQIIEAHNGTIHMDSKFDNYTKITFSVPLK